MGNSKDLIDFVLYLFSVYLRRLLRNTHNWVSIIPQLEFPITNLEFLVMLKNIPLSWMAIILYFLAFLFLDIHLR